MKRLAYLLLIAASFLVAQSKGIDFTVKLVNIDGKPFTNGDAKPAADLTLKDACVLALESSTDDDRQATGADKFKRDELARKIYHDAKNAILTVDELALIKDRVGKIYGAAVVGAVWRLLDPAVTKESKGEGK